MRTNKPSLTRRELLRMSGLALAFGLLQACAPAATEAASQAAAVATKPADRTFSPSDPAVEPLKAALRYRYRPHFILLDGDGSVVDAWVGSVSENTFVEAFDRLLKQ